LVAAVRGASPYGEGFIAGNDNDDPTASDEPCGLLGRSEVPDGIGVLGYGLSHGVWGEIPGRSGVPSDLQNAFGFLAGLDFTLQLPTGVYGESSRQGVVGVSKTPTGQPGAGVVGIANQTGTDFNPDTSGSGVLGSGYIGVRAETTNGTALLARTFGTGDAARFEGNVNVIGRVSVTDDLLLTSGRDIAERFEVSVIVHYQPGMLMVIGENGALEPCTCPYDRRAIGVISGAGTFRPAVTLAARESEGMTVPIALVGTVACLVDADLGPVKAGDLVTSSETPGYAMRATDPVKSFGSIVGKALAPLCEGRGLVPIVICLQ